LGRGVNFVQEATVLDITEKWVSVHIRMMSYLGETVIDVE
jgi:hypothetical protein